MAMTPRVFVINQPLKFDRQAGHLVKLDLSAAEVYGPLVHLLPAGDLQDGPQEIVDFLRAGLADFTPLDMLLLVGDPRAIAWAAAIVADMVEGNLRLLRWQRTESRYQLVEACVYPINTEFTGEQDEQVDA